MMTTIIITLDNSSYSKEEIKTARGQVNELIRASMTCQGFEDTTRIIINEAILVRNGIDIESHWAVYLRCGVRYLKIDLSFTGYKLRYNSYLPTPRDTDPGHITFLLPTPVRFLDMLKKVSDLATKEWTGLATYSCQDFAIDLIDYLGVAQRHIDVLKFERRKTNYYYDSGLKDPSDRYLQFN